MNDYVNERIILNLVVTEQTSRDDSLSRRDIRLKSLLSSRDSCGKKRLVEGELTCLELNIVCVRNYHTLLVLDLVGSRVNDVWCVV